MDNENANPRVGVFLRARPDSEQLVEQQVEAQLAFIRAGEAVLFQEALLKRRPEFAETEASRAILRNMSLEARVRSALRADEATQDVDVTVTSNAGHVVLSGMVLAADELPAADRVAAAVPGVVDLDNQLRVMARSRLFPGGL